jgi:sporadic carbohydrate cluster protein (TIGR04323 family)
MIFKGYISSRKLLDGSINHQKVQNLVIRDACHKRKYEYKLSLTEYGIKNCFLAFNQILLEIEKDKFDGIAFYSLTQLPEKKADREKLYKIIIKKKKKILFSLENKLVSNISEIRKLENLLKIKYLLKFTPKKIKY